MVPAQANTARRLADGALDGGEAEAFRLASQLAVLLEEGADRMARRVVEEVSEAAVVALDARGAGVEIRRTRIVRGDESRRRRGCHVDSPRRGVAAPPRVPRG